MLDAINLALPFFGLIVLGFAFGKLKRIPDDGLARMNFFINVFVIARRFEAWVGQASSAVLAGALVSVVTFPTVLWLVKPQQLPVLICRY